MQLLHVAGPTCFITSHVAIFYSSPPATHFSPTPLQKPSRGCCNAPSLAVNVFGADIPAGFARVNGSQEKRFRPHLLSENARRNRKKERKKSRKAGNGYLYRRIGQVQIARAKEGMDFFVVFLRPERARKLWD